MHTNYIANISRINPRQLSVFGCCHINHTMSICHTIMSKSTLIIFLCVSLHTISALAKSGTEIIQENGLKPFVEPLLHTHWSQDGGENILLPLSDDGSHMKAGCGPVAIAQIMNYWNFPEKGISDNHYIWERAWNDYVVRCADFSSEPYQWNNMASVYKNTDTSDAQLHAVGKLLFDLGVALEIKYDEYFGSPTQIEYIHTVIKRFFGYNPNSTILRMSNGYDYDEWREIIYKELSEGRPVLMGGDYYGTRHIFVADGYDEEGLIHLNMGHANINKPNHDTYYDITKPGVTYTDNMRMIVGISPEPLDEETTELYVESPGTLENALAKIMNPAKVCRLKISGTINDNDISILNKLTMTETGQLTFIDMSHCSIENDTIPEEAFSFDTQGNYTLQEIILPESLKHIGRKAFMNCVGLYKAVLPEGMESISDYSFSNCRYLNNIALPQSLQKIGANPFRYCKMDSFTVVSGNANFDIVDNFLTDISHKTLYSSPLKPSGDISIPEGITSLYAQAFIKSPLITSMTLPASVKNIGSWTFSHCYFLEDIYSHNPDAPQIKENSFENARLQCTLHIPEGSTANYSGKGWNIFENIVEDLASGGIQHLVNNAEITGIYTLKGMPINKLSMPGIYIIKYADGRTSTLYLRVP